jgi:hypothetical protein
MNKLPLEILKYINDFKPPHPLESEIKKWRGFNNKPTSYFYKYYLRQNNVLKTQHKRKYIEEHKLFLFKCMLEDGYTNEQIVKLNYKSKLEKIKLAKRLLEMNIKSYMVRTCTHFPKLNKHGNFSEVYYNDVEIIF